jgi:hypothetical protein
MEMDSDRSSLLLSKTPHFLWKNLLVETWYKKAKSIKQERHFLQDARRDNIQYVIFFIKKNVFMSKKISTVQNVE